MSLSHRTLAQAYKLPILMPKLEVTDLMEKMAVDKKNKGGKKYVTLLECIGRCHMQKVSLCFSQNFFL